MSKTVKETKEFLNELFLKDHNIIYILNEEDNEYYMINNMRIDTDGDVVFDISL